jgi:glycosyltransferase involved in cell wall biosynthesis
MVVLHNSIDTRVFCPADEGEAAGLAGRPTRLVLYVGRLSPEKGIETLIRAVRISRSRDSRIRLLVVGNARGYGATASYLEQLKVFADSLLGGAAEFRPAMSDVVGVYRSADITVLPTIWEEAFGRVIIESMACGIPCLASRSGGVPEILTGELGDLLFDKGNAEDLSSKIDKYVDWRLVNPEISVLCRTKVLNEFSSEVGRDRLLKVLKEASGEEAQSP